MIKLFVIDDHYLIGAGLMGEFDGTCDDLVVMGFAQDLITATEKLKSTETDVIILDLFIKLTDPVANIRHLKKTFPKTPIVILTYDDSIKWQCRMFAEGAHAYLHKSDPLESMRDVICQVAAGRIVLPHAVARYSQSKMNEIVQPVLLPDEKEILNEMAMGNTLKDIASKRLRTASAIEKTLKRVKNRFKLSTTYELMAYMSRVGEI